MFQVIELNPIEHTMKIVALYKTELAALRYANKINKTDAPELVCFIQEQ